MGKVEFVHEAIKKETHFVLQFWIIHRLFELRET